MGRTNYSAKRKIELGIVWCMYGVYGLLCLYLYIMQAKQPLDYNNRYFQSDLPYHISMIVDDGWYYSFTAYVYRLLYTLAGGNGNLIAGFLAIVTVGTVAGTETLLREFQEKTSPLLLGLESISCNLLMAFFLPLAGKYRYVSYQNGNLWHNSTYLVMRFLAVFAMVLYIRMEREYREKISVSKWIGFTILLIICTGVKPSFLTVFAPALALKLLWDLFHKVDFWKVFFLGCSVLPACGVVLWQNAVLFGEETGNGFEWNPWYTFSLHADRPKVAVLCSLAFPGIVALMHLKKIFSKPQYFFAWLMTAVGFLEALLLSETGTRSRDGNFLWGYLFAIFYINIYSTRIWLEDRPGKADSPGKWILFVICGCVFFYELYGGVYFFLRLLSGETYFMLG